MATHVNNGSHEGNERECSGGEERERSWLVGAEGRNEGERRDDFKDADGYNGSIGKAEREAPVVGSEGLGPAPVAEDLREPDP